MKNKQIIAILIIIGFLIPSTAAVSYIETDYRLQNREDTYYNEGVIISSDVFFTSKSNEFIDNKIDLDLSLQDEKQIEGNKGWPVTLDTYAILSSPVAYDFDEDGLKEIVITTFGDESNPYGSGKIYILSSDGDIISGWPYNTTGPCPATPAIGDLDNDGIVEIVVTCWYNIFIFHFDGTILWQKYDSGIFSTTPVLADVDLDGFLDIILTVKPGKICVFDRTGNYVSGWPVTIDPTLQYELSTPVVCDLDLDGYIEIVVNTENDETYVYNHDGSILTGWPVTLPNDPDWWANVNRAPALGDIDNDGHIEIIRDAGDLIIVYNSVGTISTGWPQSIEKFSNNGFSLGFIDDDEIADIVFSRTYINGYLYAFKGDGTNIAGFPVNLAGKTMLTPTTIADIDDDDEREIITRTPDEIYVFNHDGTVASGWPQTIYDSGHQGTINPSPLITDLDGDGDIEIVASSCYNSVYVFDVSGSCNVNTFDWPIFQHDLYHTGLLSVLNNSSPTIPDIDGDQISYIVDWGDNSTLETYGPEESGVEVIASHTWSEEGTYLIKVKARDENGLESDWGILEVEMPVITISSVNIFLQFLERCSNIFPMVCYILGQL